MDKSDIKFVAAGLGDGQPKTRMYALTLDEVHRLKKKHKGAKQKWVEVFLMGVEQYETIYHALEALQKWRDTREAFKMNGASLAAIREGLRWSYEKGLSHLEDAKSHAHVNAIERLGKEEGLCPENGQNADTI
jgi:hypothetical protein